MRASEILQDFGGHFEHFWPGWVISRESQDYEALDTIFAENDHRNYNIKGEAFDIGDTFSGVNFEKGIEAVEQLKKIVPDNFSLSTLALKWILSHDAVSVVIPGAVNKSQVKNIINLTIGRYYWLIFKLTGRLQKLK